MTFATQYIRIAAQARTALLCGLGFPFCLILPLSAQAPEPAPASPAPARQGAAKQGKADKGKAKPGETKASKAKQGKAKQGKAKQGKAKQGKAKQGEEVKKKPGAQGGKQEAQGEAGQKAPPPQGKGEPKATEQGNAQHPQSDPTELLAPFDSEGLLGRLRSAVGIEHLEEDVLVNSLLSYLTGERKQLVLEVRTLVQALSDVRFRVREDAEKSLLNLGPRVRSIIEEISLKDLPFEAQVRLENVKTTLGKMGDEDIQRRARMARGLAECLEYRLGNLESGALLLALDHIDPNVRLSAIRSLGAQLRDPERARHMGEAFFKRTLPELTQLNLERRNATLTALGSMPLPNSEALLKTTLGDAGRATSMRLLALRLLYGRHGNSTAAELNALCLGKENLGKDGKGRDAALLRDSLAYLISQDLIEKKDDADAPTNKDEGTPPPKDEKEKSAKSAESNPPQLLITLKDQGSLSTSVLGTWGEKIELVAPEAYGDLDVLSIPRGRIDRIENPNAKAVADPGNYLVLLKTGTRLRIDELVFDGKTLKGKALGRNIEFDRSELRSIFPAGVKLRAYGGSRVHDQLRLKGKEGKPIEGDLVAMDSKGFKIKTKEGEREIKRTEFSSILFKVKRSTNNEIVLGDLNQYIQIDLVDDQRLVGYLLDLTADHVGLASRNIGCLALPLTRTRRIQLSNSGQALTGFRLIVNYEVSKVVEIDGEGRVVWELEDLFYPADAELLVNGNVLITEQADGAVREYNRKGDIIWEYTELSRPRSATKLANGNILVADPSGYRVIEISPDKKIVWKFDKKDAGKAQFRPYDAERLNNGNTLIVDYDGMRLLEVGPNKRVAWEFKGQFLDADRLPNGNTLACRSTGKGEAFEVIEIAPNKQIVWRIKTKDYPYDVDRLPDGNTIVAEEGGVRIYNREGRMIKTVYNAWSYEVNSY